MELVQILKNTIHQYAKFVENESQLKVAALQIQFRTCVHFDRYAQKTDRQNIAHLHLLEVIQYSDYADQSDFFHYKGLHSLFVQFIRKSVNLLVISSTINVFCFFFVFLKPLFHLLSGNLNSLNQSLLSLLLAWQLPN